MISNEKEKTQKEYIFVATRERLCEMCDDLRKQEIIGIDLECENGLHHYGTYAALFQISTRSQNYLLDPIVLEHFECFLEILKDENIIKVFHDIGFDFRILGSCYGITPRNLFDSQIAAHFLGKEQLGLSSLLEEYFGVSKKSQFQKADWTRRPINNDMLKYAVKDSMYLISLKEKLEAELKALGRYNWFKEECEHLTKQTYTLDQQEYDQVKGFSMLSETNRAVLKELFQAREELAKKVDRPVHFIINTKRLVELAQKKPSLQSWKNIQGVHPIVRKFARKLFDAQEQGKSHKVHIERKRVKRFSNEQKKLFDQLQKNRDILSEQEKLPAHLFASKEQIKEYVISQNKDIFRPWQQRLLKI